MNKLTELINNLSDITFIQWIMILFACVCLACIAWTILTYIFISVADSAKGSNKKLMDNINRFDKKYK